MENMEIWKKVQNTPKEARKEIMAGRLKGFTDINPMWRFKTLTETFGPCGIGWKYEIVSKWTERGSDDSDFAAFKEIKCFVECNMYIKDGDRWSDAIPGIGGSSFVAMERSGPYVSDECYKMALTDALSVCCKALGMSADIYFEKDRDKYTAEQKAAQDGGRESTSSALRAPSPQGEGSAPGRQTAMEGVQVGTCAHCGRQVPIREIAYSRDKYKQDFCRECQKGYVEWLKKNREGRTDENN